jgi:hypothetical protein
MTKSLPNTGQILNECLSTEMLCATFDFVDLRIAGRRGLGKRRWFTLWHVTPVGDIKTLTF